MRAIQTRVPAKPEPAERYPIYLHDRIIELKGLHHALCLSQGVTTAARFRKGS